MYLPHVVCGWLCSSDMVLLVMWYRWYRYNGDMVLLVVPRPCGTVVSEGGALTPFVLPAVVAWMCVCGPAFLAYMEHLVQGMNQQYNGPSADHPSCHPSIIGTLE